MLGATKRKAVTEQVTKAVKSAGTLTLTALAVAGAALVVAFAALVLAVRRPARV